MQQNLALVLGLGGKYAEARSVADAALPADKASDNVAYLQEARGGPRRCSHRPPANKTDAERNASANLPPPTYQLGAASGKREQVRQGRLSSTIALMNLPGIPEAEALAEAIRDLPHAKSAAADPGLGAIAPRRNRLGPG